MMQGCVAEPTNDPVEEGQARILLVEDELLVRMMLVDELQELGFQVIEAATGDEAADALMTGTPVDIVFSDVRMPGTMDGLGLLDFVREHYVGLPVVLCSGTLSPDEAIERGAAAFIAKPFLLPYVAAVLKGLLKPHED